MNDCQTDVVIVANGTFPTHPVPLAVLRNARHIVACDGAIAQLAAHPSPLTPHLTIVGDGDSVPDEFRHLLIRVDEQEDNDLTKATRYCLEQGWRRIAYIGATGLREDHTIGNVALLMRYYRQMGVEGVMLTDHGRFTPAKGTRTFDSQKGQQVSIFNFGCTQIESKGLRWASYAYGEWWQGTLNEATGNNFTLHTDGYYLVYQTYI
ncbi:MAG: thiamine diphosphokinase [Prevotella sp.]|nr:thiamine diphosphokinase [Prevotella sp.]